MQFYVIEPEKGLFGTKWAYGESEEPKNRGEPRTCPVCGSFLSLMTWLPPHRMKLSSAKPEKWPDFLWADGHDLMVSGRFKSIYEVEGLSGITRFHPPAEIVRVGNKKRGDLPADLPTYHLVDILWGGANLDDKASGAVFKHWPLCEFCRSSGAVYSRERIILEPDSWTGADIFQARGVAGEILVSERFKEVVERYGLTNLLLISAERYGYDEFRPGQWYIHEK